MRRFPVVQAQTELAHGILVVHRSPLLDSLGLAFDPLRQASHYNMGLATLLQKCQQLAIEETGISS